MVLSLLVGVALLPAVVTTQPNVHGVRHARQEIAATGTTRAESRTIYLNRGGAILRPGLNDSSNDISSIVSQPTIILGWDIDDDTWSDTVACMREIYAPFDVTITEDDPGDIPHIEALFGGHPSDVGLPDDVGGVSPFTTDCAIIERSIVFTFTDVLDDDPRTVCETMAQEVAHSFGLDHEMLASDPMTYLSYLGERSFQNEMASCGEYGGRMCGINGSVCRTRQNSYALLMERLGARGEPDASQEADEPDGPAAAGCSSGRGGSWLVGLLLLRFRSRTRSRSARGRCPRGP